MKKKKQPNKPIDFVIGMSGLGYCPWGYVDTKLITESDERCKCYLIKDLKGEDPCTAQDWNRCPLNGARK